MSREVTLFEKTQYQKWLSDTIEETANVLIEWISSIVVLNDRSIEPFIESLISKGKKYDAPINGKFLLSFVDAQHKKRYIDLLKRKLGNIPTKGTEDELFRKSNNDAVLSIFDDVVEDMSSDELKELCLYAFKGADVAAPFKIISFAGSNKKLYKGYTFHNDYVRFLQGGEDARNAFQRGCSDCSEIRNKYYGHSSKLKIEELTKEIFIKNMSTMEKTLSPLVFPKASQKKSLRDNLLEKIVKYKTMVDLPPVAVSDANQKIEGFDIDYIEKHISTGGHYDKENDIIYWHSYEEIKEIVDNRLLEKRQASAELAKKMGEYLIIMSNDLMNEGNNGGTMPIDFSRYIKALASTSENEQPINKITFSELMPNMQPYSGGPLSEDQMDELAEKTLIIADADFWLNKQGSQYLSRGLNKRLKKYSRKIIIDWNTRVELFEIEKNTGGAYTEQEVRAAKTAHETISLMHRHGYVQYLPQSEEALSSRKSILKIVRDNPEVLFTVFSSDDVFYGNMIKNDIRNAIPIYLLPNLPENMRPERIKTSALPLLKACFSGAAGKETIKETSSDKTTNSNTKTTAEAVHKTVDEEPEKNTKTKAEFKSPKKILKQGDIATNLKGEKIILDKELGKGGEGVVFATNKPNAVAKIYFTEKLDEEKQKKIQFMCENNPHIKELCWPEEVLYDEDGVFVGYTMKDGSGYVEFGVSVLKLNSPSVRDKSMQGWNRLSLVKLCEGIAKTFKTMHQAGILMGDVNPRNMMVDPQSRMNPSFLFVDCDSYQIGKYPCPVGTMPFTSPKIYKKTNINPRDFKFGEYMRTIEDENYAIASLLFNILMLNQSPFAGKGTTNIEEAMFNYNFAYRISGDSENTGIDTPDGPFRLIWNNTPKNIKDLFASVFKDVEDVGVEEWIDKLSEYTERIQRGDYTSELTPVLYWDVKNQNRRMTVDFVCDACGVRRNMPKERHEKEEKYNDPHLCNECRTASFELKDDPEKVEVICSKCHNTYFSNKWEAWLGGREFQRQIRKPICPSCNQDVLRVCEGCGQQYRAKRFKVNRKYCNECNQTTSAVCGNCGRPHDVKIGKIRALERAGKQSFCNECIDEMLSKRY